MDKNTLIELIKQDYSLNMMARHFGKSQTTIRYHLAKFGLKTNHKKIGEKNSKVWIMNDEEFTRMVSESPSIAESLRRLGMTRHPNNYQSFRLRCKKLGIIPNKAKNGQGKKLPILRENSTSPRSSVKSKVLREGLLDYRCQICGLGPEWNGKELGLTLDHINGVSNDHRIDNLRFVCPNCDRQLPTYCNKNWGIG